MNFNSPAFSSWRTTDGSPWWLRDDTYDQPNGDYEANCYMDLWHNPPNADSITFDDNNCEYHSNAYYCQTAVGEGESAPFVPGGVAPFGDVQPFVNGDPDNN